MPILCRRIAIVNSFTEIRKSLSFSGEHSGLTIGVRPNVCDVHRLNFLSETKKICVFVSVAKRFNTSAPWDCLLSFSNHFTICFNGHKNTVVENIVSHVAHCLLVSKKVCPLIGSTDKAFTHLCGRYEVPFWT